MEVDKQRQGPSTGLPSLSPLSRLGHGQCQPQAARPGPGGPAVQALLQPHREGFWHKGVSLHQVPSDALAGGSHGVAVRRVRELCALGVPRFAVPAEGSGVGGATRCRRGSRLILLRTHHRRGLLKVPLRYLLLPGTLRRVARGGGLLSRRCGLVVPMMLRWSFEGVSMGLRRGFEGNKGKTGVRDRFVRACLAECLPAVGGCGNMGSDTWTPCLLK